MKVSIIVIGDEILLGRVTDTNSGFLSRTIDPLGWQVTDVATVADRHSRHLVKFIYRYSSTTV